jgi:predicted rRNA methylase YqxC with S4 and FtsJ domains
LSEDDFIEALILNGAIEVAAIDMSTGNMLYRFTPKLKEISPELYAVQQAMFREELMSLWEEGFVDVDPTEENPKVTLTPKAFSDVDVDKLDDEKKTTLKEIIRIMLQN